MNNRRLKDILNKLNKAINDISADADVKRIEADKNLDFEIILNKNLERKHNNMRKFTKITLIILILFIGLLILTGCNQEIVDTHYTFDKAITYIGNERIEIEIKTWRDYEDGEQIQIVAKDGTVYLLSMNNTILIKEPNK